MWLAIIGIADKILGALGQVITFWLKRSDESKKIQREQQAIMDKAAKEGDHDAYWNARARRNRG